MGKGFYLALVLVCVMCLVSASVMAVPEVINYQGKLTNSSDCVLTGIYEMRFSLYDVGLGGTALWGPEMQNITVTDGIFNVQLGAVEPFVPSLFDNDDLYLEMEALNPDTGEYETLSPRQRVTSVAFAKKAEISDYATLAGSVEDGSVSTTKLTNGAITGEKIADGAVGTVSLANDVVTSEKIKNHTIQQEDLGFSPFPVDGHSLDAADGDPVDAVYVDNEGRVGIGTTSPAGKLDVGGGKLMVTDSGNVGIGTSSPVAYLHIQGGEPRIRFTDSQGNNAAIHYEETSASGLEFRIPSADSHGDTKFFIGNSGNIGIGTTSPSERLEVAGIIKSSSGGFKFPDGTVQTTAASGGGGIGGSGADNYIPRWDGTSTLENSAIYQSDTGNVGIGTTNFGAGQKFSVSSDDNDIASFLTTKTDIGEIHIGGSVASSDALVIGFDRQNHYGYLTIWGSGGGLVIANSGNVGIGTASPSYKLHVAGDAMADHWYTSSDSRLKENIIPLENAIDKVSALRGIYFNMKDESPSKREVGVIAQEVESVLPEVVSEDDKGYKSVDYSKLTPLLIEAVKELKAHDEELKAQNEALKALVCQDHPEAQVCQ